MNSVWEPFCQTTGLRACDTGQCWGTKPLTSGSVRTPRGVRAELCCSAGVPRAGGLVAVGKPPPLFAVRSFGVCRRSRRLPLVSDTCCVPCTALPGPLMGAGTPHRRLAQGVSGWQRAFQWLTRVQCRHALAITSGRWVLSPALEDQRTGASLPSDCRKSGRAGSARSLGPHVSGHP